MRKILVIISGVLASWSVFGQKVSNVRASSDSNRVVITYDLEGKNPTDRFNISLLSSINNFTEPLKEVEGEVGTGIRPGTDLTITWNAEKEVGSFDGNVTFEVRASLMSGYFSISVATGKIKKGKKLNIKWSGGNSDENIKIELLRYGQTAALISENIKNSGSLSWGIPKSLKSSGGYRVKVTDLSKEGYSGISGDFKISSGFSATFIIIPGVIIIGTVAYLVTKGSKTPETPVTPDNSLPVPPSTP